LKKENAQNIERYSWSYQRVHKVFKNVLNYSVLGNDKTMYAD